MIDDTTDAKEISSDKLSNISRPKISKTWRWIKRMLVAAIGRDHNGVNSRINFLQILAPSTSD